MTLHVTPHFVMWDVACRFVWLYMTSLSSITFRVTSVVTSFCAMPRSHVTLNDFRSRFVWRLELWGDVIIRDMTSILAMRMNWSLKSELWSVKYEVWTVKCEVVRWRHYSRYDVSTGHAYELWSLKSELWSVKYEVWSLKCPLPLSSKGRTLFY